MSSFPARFLFCATVLASTSALAAPLPSSIDPAHVQDNFGTLERHPELGEQPVLPHPKAPKKGALSGSTQHFMVRDVVIEGSTVYSPEQLKAFYADTQGHSIALGDIQAVADKITAQYRSDGYMLSQAVVPKQDVTKGVVHIRVVEGYITKVVIKGDTHDGRGLIQKMADKISSEKPSNLHTIERYLLLINDLPGITARSTLHPSTDTFGAAEMVLEVEHKAMDASFSTDNRGSRYIGPWQYSGSAGINSALGLDERTTIRGITASPLHELRMGDIVHEEQLDSEGTRLILNGSLADTAPHYTLTPLDITGQSLFWQAKVQHPFIRSREENLIGDIAFDYRNTRTDSQGTELSDDHIRALRANAGYGFVDRFAGSNQTNFQFSQGINVFGASENDPKRSRADGKSDFTKLNLDLSHLQPLHGPFSLFGAVSGQYSFNPLLPAEQFVLGGSQFGSAYDPAELSGDDGMALRAELRYAQSPGLSYLNTYEPYSFYDIGKVWNRDTLDGTQSLASAGIGMRATFTPWLSGSTELAYPLTKPVATEHNNDLRLFVSLTGKF
jgi:hemolysin activation/secretion protein